MNQIFWVQVLDRLFLITLALSKNSLSFRGQRVKASLNEVYNGHFLTQI